MCGASPDFVRRTLAERDPLPGAAGSAGEPDGRLVRDMFGCRPLFSEHADPAKWSFDHRDLDGPTAVSTGCTRRVAGEAAGDDERVWSLPDPPAAADRDAVLDCVRGAVFESVRSVDDDGLTIVFSGGIDSAVVAAGVLNAPCYVAGFEGFHDVAAACETTAAMDHDLTMVELICEALERTVLEVIAALSRTTLTDV